MIKDLNISKDVFESIASEISSDKSVVGIDAKKTHILILHMLIEMGERLDRIEEKLGINKEE